MLLLGGLAVIMLGAIVIPIVTSWFANTTLPAGARSTRASEFINQVSRRWRRRSP